MPWRAELAQQVEQVRRSRSSLRAAVGSSRMSSLTSLDSALAISTSCCLPTPRSVTCVSGFSLSPTLLEQLDRLACWSAPVDDAAAWRCSLPRKMFSAIDSCGTSASSWWMMTMPACSLSRMSRNWHCSPSKRISPS